MKTLTNRFAHYALSTYTLGTMLAQKVTEVTGLSRINYSIGRQVMKAVAPSMNYPTYQELLEQSYAMFEAMEAAGHALIDGDEERAKKLFADCVAERQAQIHLQLNDAAVEEIAQKFEAMDKLRQQMGNARRTVLADAN